MFQSTCSVWDATRPAARWRWAWAGFNPRAPYGARLPSTVSFRVPPVFQSTRPVRGRDLSARPVPVRHVVSIHAPRAGRDFAGWFWLMGYHAFQSTRPVRGATTLRECRRNRILVSIHAPRAGRDFRKADFAWGISVSIHAPRAGRDLDAPCHRHEHQRFQSTRPVRGATRRTCIVGNSARGFNPRAPCGARPIWVQVLLSCCVFQSTRPVRGATVHLHRVRQLGQVSIHAPRAGRDGTVHDVSHEDQPVSIHAPRAGRDVGEAQRLCGVPVSIHAPRAGRDRGVRAKRRAGTKFQSTRPVRGATGGVAGFFAGLWFQSTRPVRGATRRPRWRRWQPTSFNPRAPCGARLGIVTVAKVDGPFQSTRPVRGATWTGYIGEWGRVFQSTRPVRGATPEPSLPRTRLSFQSTRPVRGATCSIPSRIFWLEFQSTRPVRGATWT